MIKKSMKATLLFYKNILTKYCASHEKFKKISSLICDSKAKEKGAVVITTLGWTAITVATVIAGWYAAKLTITEKALDFLCGLLVYVADLIRVISGFLCYTAADMFQTSLKWLGEPITSNTTFIGAWSSVRDFSNMFIVLGFVIIGIATALRLKDYEAKKLLLPLIVVALLINFSGLFCGLIIDASNIISTSLIQQSGGGSTVAGSGTGIRYYKVITNTAKSILEANPSGKDENTNTAYLLANLGIAGAYLMVAGIFFYMAIIFLARYAMLAFLFILAPLAFVCKVFPLPAAQKIWNDWWQNFLKWAFIGVGGSFALWISAQTMAFMSTKNAGKIGLSELAVVLIFLFVGFKITTKSSATGASAVMGLVSGAAGFATKTVVAGGKISGLAGIAQRGGQKVQDAATQIGQKLNWVKQGTLESNIAARLAEPTKRLDAIQDNTELAKIAEQRPITAIQSADKAAAAQILAKRNALKSINPTKLDAVMAHAGTFGVSAGTFTKAEPTAGAEFTDKEVREKLMNDKIDDLVLREGMTLAAARNQLQYSTAPTETEMTQAHIEMRQQKITENALGISPITDRDVNNKLIEDKQSEYIKTGLSREAVAQKMKEYKPTDADRVDVKQKLSKERIEIAVKKVNPGKVPELPSEAMPAFAKHAGENQITSMLKNGTDDKVSKFRTAYFENVNKLKNGSDAEKQETQERMATFRKASSRLTKEEENEEPETSEGGTGI